MGRNKIETDFRNKLNQREITPTDQAWDRLDAMLTVVEGQKPKRKYPWMYIAASIIGFLFIGIGYYNKNENTVGTKSNEVVIENNIKNTPVQEKSEMPLKVKMETPIVILETNKVKKEKQLSAPIHKKTDKVIVYNQNQIAENPVIISKKEQKIEQQSIIPKIIDDEKIVANIEAPSFTKKSAVKVDAASLLSQVDGELELSFREKVIKTVDKNYKTVKVALANRNQQ